jgi:hypothetical protein
LVTEGLTVAQLVDLAPGEQRADMSCNHRSGGLLVHQGDGGSFERRPLRGFIELEVLPPIVNPVDEGLTPLGELRGRVMRCFRTAADEGAA